MRFSALITATVVAVAAVVLLIVTGGIAWIVIAALAVAFVLVGAYDLIQRRHSVLRNYPILGHMRFNPRGDPA